MWNIFAKNSMLDVWQVSEYAFDTTSTLIKTQQISEKVCNLCLFPNSIVSKGKKTY